MMFDIMIRDLPQGCRLTAVFDVSDIKSIAGATIDMHTVLSFRVGTRSIFA
jgi:hypothetical protein